MPSKHRDRSRSRSPYRGTDRASRRSRSPLKPKKTPSSARILPLKARPLHKDDLSSHRHLFALYLDVQKQIDADDLDDKELRGRWKSFVKKWNNGDLAEGWYDPETKIKADSRAYPPTANPRPSNVHAEPPVDGSDSDGDSFGPSLPSREHGGRRAGPAIPKLQDLDHRDELRAEDRITAREDLAYERKQERKLAREQLDELVPRADPGSRERQLEKKRETAAMHRSFRDAKSPGLDEAPEADLLGDGGFDMFKKRKEEEEKKKNDRQVRKEEVWRARAEEREERMKIMRQKEDKTMDVLKALAKQRYG